MWVREIGSGLGTALIVITSVIWLREPVTVIQPGLIALILTGVVALHLVIEAHWQALLGLNGNCRAG